MQDSPLIIQPIKNVTDYLCSLLKTHLEAGRRVLWLVPGGSAITVAAEVSQGLRGVPLEHLTVSLTDERFGPLGHADSNWLQLDEAGFSLPKANLIPVLSDKDMAETVADFDMLLGDQFAAADATIGFFGIGPDGHTAGILPGSPAVDALELAAGYDAGVFARITMTPMAIAQLDEAVVYARGEAKWPILKQLSRELPLSEQPAQALKQAGKLTVFSDYPGILED